MPKNTKVQDLKINILTEAQYDAAVREEVIGDYELSLLTDVVDKAIQVKSLPIASAEELNNVYQYVGTTTLEYTNGYFYKCTTDGSTYAWEQLNVQPAGSASSVWGSITGTLSNQTDLANALNAKADSSDLSNKLNKTTEASKLYGTNASGEQVRYNLSQFAAASDLDPLVIQWPVLPEPTASLEGVIYEYVGETNSSYTKGYFYTCVSNSSVESVSTMPAASAEENGHMYKYIGETNSSYTNGMIYKCTFDYLMAADWGQPDIEVYSWKEVITDASSVESVSTMPAASASEEGNIYQYTGETDTTYTNGCFYKCISYLSVDDWSGDTYTSYTWRKVETLEGSNDTYAWEQIDVQPNQGAVINDNSTSLTETWSSSKINSMIGDIESLLAAI